ncbi:hypothetical protein C6497_09430 [Candidatus Poribacteria bacterium]|nr:MAG: hypothetical protein C6497_09430 [Candidatus Poribacteria bacterium]
MAYNDGRKQLRRLLDLIRTLERPQGIRVAALASIYDVDKSRIYDDLKILEEYYTLEKKDSCYRIIGQHKKSWPRITKSEAKNLKLIIEASPLVKQQRFNESLKSLLEKIHLPLARYIEKTLGKEADTLQETETDYLHSNNVSVQLKSDGFPTENDIHFDVLEQALQNRKAVRASYLSGGKTETIEHVLHPYAIFFRKEDWYLEAHSNLSENASLTFKIIRFQKVELTEETFEPPSDFSLSEDLASRWELFSGDPISVTLKIAANKVYLVTEKERHRSQKIIEQCPDGSVIVSYEVPKEEFTFWVLSLGDAVEVLDPPEFRSEFAEIVHRMHNVYSED